MVRGFQKCVLIALVAAYSIHQIVAEEHIVIIDRSHPASPDPADVWKTVGLHKTHQNVSCVWNNSAFTGFAATIRPAHVSSLLKMGKGLLIEKSTSVIHTGVIRREEQTYSTRANATWGLEKISNVFFTQRDPQDMDYTYTFQNDAPGEGADIYIIDSGIWVDHIGFDGRARMIWSFDGNDTDTDGHGTHVAGTAGAADFGVASAANVFGVRVLDDKGQGSTATVIAGIDYVITQHDQRKQSATGFTGSVMSISLAAAGQVSALDQAIAAAVRAGIHTCVAAGNEAVDACTGSPAASGGDNGPAITVGSIGISGQQSSFSNFGKCVDVYAPGEEVLSAGMQVPNLLVFLTGTSQATPHVTGLVAYAMSNRSLANDPALMKDWIKSTALPQGDGTTIANNGADLKMEEGVLGLHKVVAPVHSSDFIASQSGLRGVSPKKRYISWRRQHFDINIDS